MFRTLRASWYSMVLTVMLLAKPAMAFSVSEIGDYMRGVEFRSFMGEIITQIFSGFAYAFFTAIAASLFGLLGSP